MRSHYLTCILSVLILHSFKCKAQTHTNSSATSPRLYSVIGVCGTMDFYHNQSLSVFDTNTGQYDKNVPATFFGPHASIAYCMTTGKSRVLQVGLDYSFTQYYVAKTRSTNKFGYETLKNAYFKAHCLSVPLYFTASLAQNRLLVGAGPSLDFLISKTTADKIVPTYDPFGSLNGYTIEKIRNASGYVSPYDVGANFKATWFIQTKINPIVIEFMYKHGLANIGSNTRKMNSGIKLHQDYAVLSIGYLLK